MLSYNSENMFWFLIYSHSLDLGLGCSYMKDDYLLM